MFAPVIDRLLVRQSLITRQNEDTFLISRTPHRILSRLICIKVCVYFELYIIMLKIVILAAWLTWHIVKPNDTLTLGKGFRFVNIGRIICTYLCLATFKRFRQK